MSAAASAAPQLSVLVVSYGTRELTLACLSSLRAAARGLDVEVVVWDNASDDGSAEAVRSAFPEALVVASEENLGFGRAVNRAARLARADLLLLLNPDTLVREGTLRALLAFAAAHLEAGIVGGRTLFPDGRLNPTSCWGRPTPWSLLCAGLGLSSLLRRNRLFDPESLGRWGRDSVREVDVVTGCLLLVRRALWERLGGFDERFFMYGEDADLCLRARAAGSRCLIAPEAVIVHHGGASERVRAEKLVRLFRAKAQLFEKHWSPAAARFGVVMLDLWAGTRAAAHAVTGNAAARGAWREAWRRRAAWSLVSVRRAADEAAGAAAAERAEAAGRPLRVLAAASAGGHWVQLKRLLPAFEGHTLGYLTTDPGCRDEVGDAPFFVVPDATRWDKLALGRAALGVARAVLAFRPDVVVSTGAAPGYFAVLLGRWRGARTIWVDSIANAEELSLSGRKAGRFVDLWLTQWPHLARPEGPTYHGGVL